MNDFIDALEAELVAASRRRAAGARPGRGRPRLRALLAVAVAVAALAVAAAVLIGREPARDERPAAPAGGAWTALSVGAERADPCAERAALPRGTAAQVLADVFAVLRRSQGEPDALPELRYAGGPYDVSQWLPVGAYDRSAVRRIGRFAREVHVVPTSDLRSAPPACEPQARRLGPGACLVAGTTGEPLLWRCFTGRDVLAGRAFIAADRTSEGARLVGFVPDGVESVLVEHAGRTSRLNVADNGVTRYLDVPADGRVRVKLERARPRCAPAPSRAVLGSVEAFRLPPGGPPPAQVQEAMEGGRIAAPEARLVGRGEGVSWWVVPASWPQDDPCAPLDRACVVPVVPSGYGGVPACTRPRHLAFRWAVIAGPILDSRVSVYGVVPRRVAEARVTAGGGSARIVAHEGVLAAMLPPGARWRDSGPVTIRYVAAPDAPRVAVVGQNRRAIQRRLRREAFRIAPGVNAYAGPARTTVRFAPGHRADAEAVRRILRVHRIAPVRSGPTLGDVVVEAGSDLR